MSQITSSCLERRLFIQSFCPERKKKKGKNKSINPIRLITWWTDIFLSNICNIFDLGKLFLANANWLERRNHLNIASDRKRIDGNVWNFSEPFCPLFFSHRPNANILQLSSCLSGSVHFRIKAELCSYRDSLFVSLWPWILVFTFGLLIGFLRCRIPAQRFESFIIISSF